MNVTLSIDERIVAEARRIAALRGTSLNRLVRDYLQELVRTDDAEAVFARLDALWAEESYGSERSWTRVGTAYTAVRLDSARNEIVQPDTKSIGESPERMNGAGPATRFDVNDLDRAGVGGAGKRGLRQAAVFAPDPERRLTVDQPIGDRLREELLGPSIDSLLNSERGLEVGQIVFDAAQAPVLGFRDRHGFGHGITPCRHCHGWRRAGS